MCKTSFKPPSISLLTVPRQWFRCGLCCLFWCQSFGDVLPNVCSLYFYVRFGLLSGHLLGNSCPARLAIRSHCLLSICNIIYFPFWF